ncbi:hypothetical protein QBC46DRAFT_366585 [Diplogelasinospora grovesii]|uniref:Uncharacterized protein n=1 Tax=Diplogelasinospora grovesii TaxID=303347 RepID=A0AAN6N0G6_9PEZI|nr:hypothetical protein QBC46DRAFT_366585 [Diplogelasinospora grovesii]
MSRLPIVEDALEGAPGTPLDDFKHPKLRRFPRHRQINWLEYLGHGEEGIVFKATIGGGNPVAVKVFWSTQRPALQQTYNGGVKQPEWPFEEECRTVALIEKMKWAMQYPIHLDRKPETRHDAFKLLLAFGDERRHQSTEQDNLDNKAPPPPFPPITACHGWMTVRRDDLPQIDPLVWKEIDEQLDWHWAITSRIRIAAGQAHLDFFYATSSSLEAYGGRLVDFADVCSPFTRGWAPPFASRDARKWFSTLESAHPAIRKNTIIASQV